MIELKYIKGRDLIDFINNYDDVNEVIDVLYGWDFEYESQKLTDEEYELFFSIEHGHFTKGHSITIKKNGDILYGLDEPHDGCGAEDELEIVIKDYLENLKSNLRDTNISAIIDKEEDIKIRYKNKILTKLSDLSAKISSGEELPHGEQDSQLLSDIDDSLDELLNNWNY